MKKHVVASKILTGALAVAMVASVPGMSAINAKADDQVTISLYTTVPGAHANTNATVTIADDDQCSKSEATTALDYLGYTIDIDNTFFELRNVCLVFLFTSHLPLPSLRTSGLLHGHRRQQPGCDHDRGCHRDRRPLR